MVVETKQPQTQCVNCMSRSCCRVCRCNTLLHQPEKDQDRTPIAYTAGMPPTGFTDGSLLHASSFNDLLAGLGSLNYPGRQLLYATGSDHCCTWTGYFPALRVIAAAGVAGAGTYYNGGSYPHGAIVKFWNNYSIVPNLGTGTIEGDEIWLAGNNYLDLIDMGSPGIICRYKCGPQETLPFAVNPNQSSHRGCSPSSPVPLPAPACVGGNTGTPFFQNVQLWGPDYVIAGTGVGSGGLGTGTGSNVHDFGKALSILGVSFPVGFVNNPHCGSPCGYHHCQQTPGTGTGANALIPDSLRLDIPANSGISPISSPSDFQIALIRDPNYGWWTAETDSCYIADLDPGLSFHPGIAKFFFLPNTINQSAQFFSSPFVFFGVCYRQDNLLPTGEIGAFSNLGPFGNTISCDPVLFRMNSPTYVLLNSPNLFAAGIQLPTSTIAA